MNTVSVLSPIYNEALFVEEAMNSVAKYSGINMVEYILVDDGSSDNSFEIMSDLASVIMANNSKIRVIVDRNPNKGKNAAINHAFNLSTGKAIVLFAGDDILHAENIDARVSPLLNSSLPVVSRSAVRVFNNGNKHEMRRYPQKGGGNKSGGAVGINRKFAENYFPLPTNLPNEDTWLQAVIAALQPEIFNVDKVSLDARLHDNNSWNRHSSYDEYRSVLRRRNLAYEMALQKFSGKSDLTTIALKALCNMEKSRIEKRPLKILLQHNVSMRDKIHFIGGSSKAAFQARKALEKLLR